MKKNLITMLLIMFVPLIAYFGINFSNVPETISVDAKTTKPQIVKFTSTMCLDCQTMNKIIKEIYPEYSDKIILTEINVQDGKAENKRWIRKYNVTLVPTIIFIDSDGNQIRRVEGAITKDEMENYIKGMQ